MNVSRKSLLAAAGAWSTIGFVRYPGDAAEFVWKLSTEQPLDYHFTKRLLEAGGRIRDDSKGRFEMQLFPNSVLGSSSSQLNQVRTGAIQMATVGFNELGAAVTVAGLPWMPFVFADAKEGYAALAGPLGQYIRAAIVKGGLHPFERPWAIGFRQVINGRKPIVTPEDMKGLKFRVPASALMTSLFSALGANPTPLDFAQSYSALQTHLVDGLELAMGSIEAFKIYEVQKYVSYTNHIWTVYCISANGDAWRGLPKHLQDIVERRIDQGSVLDQADTVTDEASLEKTLKTQGMQFNNVNTNAFRTTLQHSGFYNQWKQTYGEEAWGLLEKAVGKLT